MIAERLPATHPSRFVLFDVPGKTRAQEELLPRVETVSFVNLCAPEERAVRQKFQLDLMRF